MKGNLNLRKTGGLDKIDAHKGGQPHFVHDNWRVSAYVTTKFHNSSAYGHDVEYNFHHMGVNMKAYRATSEGYAIDSYDIGKSSVL